MADNTRKRGLDGHAELSPRVRLPAIVTSCNMIKSKYTYISRIFIIILLIQTRPMMTEEGDTDADMDENSTGGSLLRLAVPALPRDDYGKRGIAANVKRLLLQPGNEPVSDFLSGPLHPTAVRAGYLTADEIPAHSRVTTGLFSSCNARGQREAEACSVVIRGLPTKTQNDAFKALYAIFLRAAKVAKDSPEQAAAHTAVTDASRAFVAVWLDRMDALGFTVVDAYLRYPNSLDSIVFEFSDVDPVQQLIMLLHNDGPSRFIELRLHGHFTRNSR